MVRDVYHRYTSLAFEPPYYREFNPRNQFKLASTPFYTYYSDSLNEQGMRMVDIGYNASIIRLFYRILMKEYFRRIKR